VRAAEQRQLRQQILLEKKRAAEERRREERTLPKYVDKIDSCTNLVAFLKEVRWAPRRPDAGVTPG